MNIAPIVLFVYNRPNLVDKVVKNLKKNTLSKSSELYIFSDGPKKNKNDILKIKKVLQTGLIRGCQYLPLSITI